MAEIVSVTADEWVTWRRLRLRALYEAPSAFGSSYEQWVDAPESRWRERLSLPESVNLLAWVEGVPVGMVSGVPGDAPETVELISMWVAPEARGHGIADSLISAICEWARTRAGEVRLDVVSENARAMAA